MKRPLALLLRSISRLAPDIPLIRAIPTRVFWPIHKNLGLGGGGVVDVLGFKMRLDPNECVDASLWFVPHLYDRHELAFLKTRFGGRKFIDLGANIGFWSAFVAHHWPEAKVLAIDANPNTYALAEENMKLNGFTKVKVLNLGAAAENGTLPLYLNETGNRGGDTLKHGGNGERMIEVPVKRLSDILAEHGMQDAEFMKVDIEGMEIEVLTELFTNSTIRPRYICAETLHSPGLVHLLQQHGYRCILQCKENAIFAHQ